MQLMPQSHVRPEELELHCHLLSELDFHLERFSAIFGIVKNMYSFGVNVVEIFWGEAETGPH
jgi:hypothetical protein